MGTWDDFVRADSVCGHAVQLYERPAELAGIVAGYVAAGLEAEHPALLVVTPDHARLFLSELADRGWDVETLRARDLLVVADAEITLASFSEGPRVSWSLFESRVGGLVDRAAARYADRPVRAYGEMVDVLWRRGETETALAVEDLWNQLARARRFDLLCAYRLDGNGAGAPRMAAVFEKHTHVHGLAAAAG